MNGYSIRRVWSSWGIWDNLRGAWALGRKMFPTKAAARRALAFANKANDDSEAGMRYEVINELYEYSAKKFNEEVKK